MSDRFDNSNSNKTLGSTPAPTIPGTEKEQFFPRADNAADPLFGGNQNTLSFCRGSEVQADRSTASDTKPTDSRTIVGSYPGDHRIPAKDGVKDSLNQASTGHGAFDTMGAQRMNQFPNGKNDKA